MRTILIASLFLVGCGGEAQVDAKRKAAEADRAEAEAFATKVRDSLPEDQRGPESKKDAPTSQPPKK
jgi:hypothetical protein